MSLTDETLAAMLQGQSLTRGLAANLSNEFQAIRDAPKAKPARKKKPPKIPDPPRHLVIPDTQIRPGVPTVHLEWIGQYIVDAFAGDDLTIIHLGDHWDMPSLSSYDQGKARMEGRRIVQDIIAGNHGFDLLNQPLADYNATKRKKWEPRRVFLHGNHENRITRAIETTAQLDGLLSLDLLNAGEWGWETYPFLEVVEIRGVHHSHYFHPSLSSRPYGGTNIDTRLKNIGHSFTMGHQQTLMYGVRTLPNGTMQHGLVCGSCYLHDEEYRGPQANAEWRGIIVCNQVENGSYDPMFVSLDFLCRKYEGMRLRDWMEKYADG